MKSNAAVAKDLTGAFVISANEGFTTIYINSDFNEASIKAFEAELAVAFDTPVNTIINCLGVTVFSKNHMRGLVPLARKLKAAGKNIRVISTTTRMEADLEAQGVASLLPISASLKDALAEFGIVVKSKSLDVAFINPFLASTVQVLKVQAHTTATAGIPFKKAPGAPLEGDISGMIKIISEKFTGAMIITFPLPTFLKIMSTMLGEEYKVLTPEIQDGVSELTNIIFGGAKSILNEQGFDIKLALPTLVMGKNASLPNSTSARVAIPFQSDAGAFAIEITLAV